MAGDVRRCDPREPFQERPHLRRAERAVDADDERIRVLDGDPERLHRLPRQVPARAVDRRERDPEREVRRLLRSGDERRLRVERVEDGFDEQQVDAALTERAICSAYVARTCSKSTARYAGSSTRGESESATFSGPTEPATNRGCPGERAVHSSAARGQAARPRGSSRRRRPRARSRPGRSDVAVKVFVVAMSAPAAK